MAGSMDVIEFVAREALTNEDKFKRLVAQLGDSSRRNRQNAAGSLAFIAKVSPELLVPHASDLVDALNRPAQTRWESLDALTALVPVESRCTDKALAGAENALFDEENGFVRLAAMRFFCAYGATTEKRSENVWPLIDEAIQCYHGDVEFNDMLNAVAEFATGKLSEHVKEALVERMSFDAHNGRGALKRKAQTIIDNVQGQ